MPLSRSLLPTMALSLFFMFQGCDSSTSDDSPPATPHDTTLRILRFGSGAYSIALKPGVVDYVSDSISSAFAQVAINAVPTDEWAQVTCDSIACDNFFALSDSGTTVKIVVRYFSSTLAYHLRLVRKRFVPPADTDFGIPWNTGLSYGRIVDARDGQSYRTIQIGTQVWMAQNLNYVAYGSFAYQNSPDSGAKYGRLYTWYSAMGAPTYSATVPAGIQGICPTGWHIPSDTEWAALETTARTVYPSSPAVALRSTAGWTADKNGTDRLGFRLLPSGTGNPQIRGVGTETDLVTRSSYSAYLAIIRQIFGTGNYFQVGSGAVENWYSVRCLQD